MRTDPDCIFCKIIAGDIPSLKLLETDKVLSFMDINPFNDGHCLVIPKAHSETLFAAENEDLAACIQTAKTVATAVDKALSPAGINIMQANGAAAGQSVFHYHMHIFPRVADDGATFNWGYKPGDMERLKEIQAKILAAMD
jgi:histidine triad (HIT) family protein